MFYPYCRECGTKLETNMRFCPQCGSPLPLSAPGEPTLVSVRSTVSAPIPQMPVAGVPHVSVSAPGRPAADEITMPVRPAAEGVTAPVQPAAEEITAPGQPAAEGVTAPVQPAAEEITAPDQPAAEGVTAPDQPAAEGIPAEEPQVSEHSVPVSDDPFSITGEEIPAVQMREDGYYVDDTPESAPQPAGGGAQLPQKHVNRVPLIFLGALIALIPIVLLIVGLASNSPSARVKRALELANAKNYNQASSLVSDVYTPQAIALKKFIALNSSMNQFAEALKTDVPANIDRAISDAGNAFAEISEENDLYYLSEVLRERYYYYQHAVDFARIYGTVLTNGESNTLYYLFKEEQAVMMIEVIANRSKDQEGETFQLRELKELLDRSSSVNGELQNYSFDAVSSSDPKLMLNDQAVLQNYDPDGTLQIPISNNVSDLIDTLLDCCSSEISDCGIQIAKDLEKWDDTDNLYRTKPNPSYTAYVGANLQRIDDWDDINNNAEKIVALLRRDVAYALITGNRYS